MNDTPDRPNTPLTRAIREYLERPGTSAIKLSKDCGMGETWIKQILSGRSKSPGADAVMRLANILGKRPEEMLDQPIREDQGTPENEAFAGTLPKPTLDMLRIYGAAEGGGGIMVMDSNPIEYRERPSYLRNVKDAFGVYVVNDSMAPAYEQGDIVHIHPGKPVKPNRDALFVKSAEDGTQYVMIKRLIKVTDKSWKVQQHNPSKIFELPRNVWQKAWRVVGSEKGD